MCGSEEERHGIVLASTPQAKYYGVKTGETIREAREKCRDLVVKDIRVATMHLAESVAERLREKDYKCKVVQVFL